MRSFKFTVLLLAGGVAIAACSGGGSREDTTTSTFVSSSTTAPPEVPLEVVPRNYQEFRAQAPVCGAETPDEAEDLTFDAPDDLGLGSETLVATIETSCGPIVIELDPAIAPETVNSFTFLAEEGFFDGTVSHRVISGFVIQAGDPTATGLGGPGYVIPDEFPDEGFAYERGLVAMANGGPGTTGSQFFILVGDAPLPPQFSVFGRVVEGFDVLDLLEAVPVGTPPGSQDPVPSTPLETIYLERVIITR